MSPIRGVSERRRLPRLGKIHTGVKKQNQKGVEYPVAVDYFVFPPEWIEQVQAAYGTDKPKSLPIVIPVEDEERWANQYYRAYSQTRGLLCKGDGETANRLVDLETGDMSTHLSERVEMRSLNCGGRDCPDYQGKRCREVMMLQFLLPDLPGLGIWQLDTGSVNAMWNVNSAAELIRLLHGKVAMLPLQLTLEPQAVKTPEGKQRIMPILNLRISTTLRQFALAPGFLSLPAPAEAVEEPSEEYPEMIAPDAQAPEGEAPEPEIEMPEAVVGKPVVEMPRATADEEASRDFEAMGEIPEEISDWPTFYRLAYKIMEAGASRLKPLPSAVAGQLGLRNMEKWTGTLEEALDELAKLNGIKDWRKL